MTDSTNHNDDETDSRYFRAFEIYTDHAVKRPMGTRMIALPLLQEIRAAIMPDVQLWARGIDARMDRLQFLLDSNPPASFMVVALVDELDRAAAEALLGGGAGLRAEMRAELADIRSALDQTAANIRAELRGEETD